MKAYVNQGIAGGHPLSPAGSVFYGPEPNATDARLKSLTSIARVHRLAAGPHAPPLVRASDSRLGRRATRT